MRRWIFALVPLALVIAGAWLLASVSPEPTRSEVEIPVTLTAQQEVPAQAIMESAAPGRAAVPGAPTLPQATSRSSRELLDACIAELGAALARNYTPRSFDARLATSVAQGGLDRDNGIQDELCRRLSVLRAEDDGAIALLAAARGARGIEQRCPQAIQSALAAATLAAEREHSSSATRQEALRALAALGGYAAVLRIHEQLLSAGDEERAVLRTALASTRDGLALAEILERSLSLEDASLTLCTFSAAQEAIARELRTPGRGNSLASQLEPVLLRALRLRSTQPRVAERALEICTLLGLPVAMDEARRWLEDESLPETLAQQALATLSAGGEAVHSLEWAMQDPRVGVRMRLLMVESALGSRMQDPLRAQVRGMLRDLAQQPGSLGRRALHALGELQEPDDLALLRSIARDGTDPLARAAARTALVRAESEWRR